MEDYTIIFDKIAIKFLNTLNSKLKARIFNKIISAKSNPFRYFIRLEGRTDFKLRIGKYRATADINRENKQIEITKIGLRKNVYG